MYIIEISLIILYLQFINILLSSNMSFIHILISIEILILSLVLILNQLSFLLDDLLGSYLSILLLPIAGGESAIGLMLTLQFYPKRGTVLIRRD